MKYFLQALEEYQRKGKAGDPNGKFTFNQLMEIVQKAIELEELDKAQQFDDWDGM